MPRSRAPYPAVFRQQMVDLVHKGASGRLAPFAGCVSLLDVSPRGYYGFLMRPPSKRAGDDAMLTSRIRSIHQRSYGTYGAPRIHAELRESGIR